MLGNLHVRFGKRDGETCLRKEMERLISTFTMVSLPVNGEIIVEHSEKCRKVAETI